MEKQLTWEIVAKRMLVIALQMGFGWVPDAGARARINGYFADMRAADSEYQDKIRRPGMKIDTDQLGVFKVMLSHGDVSDWLVDTDAELHEVNCALDEAASYVAQFDADAVIVITVKK